jgi:hypothetical protein
MNAIELEELRRRFEAIAGPDSYGFKRSRHGNYVNPSKARDWKMFQAGHKDASSDELASLCPNCHGSGEVEAFEGNGGPDAYSITAECTHCGGDGSIQSAYKGVLKLLQITTLKYFEALPFLVSHQQAQKGKS